MIIEKTNTNLAIAIPTYNRANYLDYSLEVHLPIFEKYGVKLYIFDNASTDETPEIVEKWRKKYSLIEYRQNNYNCGPDDNFQKALTYPESDYVWLLGDTYQIPEEGIIYLLNLIKHRKDYSVIVFNLNNVIRLNALKTKDYTDQNELLVELGAVMTCLSCLVYSRNFLKLARFDRYKDSNFIQTGIIFENTLDSENIVHWVQAISVTGLKTELQVKKGWYHTQEVFEIACRRWVNFIFSLPPSYSLDNKLKCILNFGKISGIFSFTNLFNLRRLGILNLKSYNQYSRYFALTIDIPNSVILLICLVPRFILKIFLAIAVLILKDNKISKCMRIFRDEI